MKVAEMHYEFNVLSQTSDSLKNASFEPYEIDNYLNKAIIEFIKDNYSFNYSIRKGFETDQVRISKLSSLLVKSPELQGAIAPVDLGNGLYELNLDSLGNNLTGNNDYVRYMFYVDGYANCLKICNNVSTNKKIKLYIYRHDELSNFYNQSSWYWGKLKASFGKSKTKAFSSLDIESNNNDQLLDLEPNNKYSNDSLSSIFLNTNNSSNEQEFIIDSVEVSYIKYPNKVYFGGYEHIDGRNIDLNKQIHCDIDDVFHQEIVQQAVLLAANDMTNIANIQLRNSQVQNNLVR